ncbi:MAG: hypothetical protein GY854_22390 [Deltaproteobacteria bacterium]|nr:hypothetical protein [Deltaproteobacteria bacterium]
MARLRQAAHYTGPGEVVDHTGGNGIVFSDARWFRGRGLFLTITTSRYTDIDAGELIGALRTALGFDSEPGPD